MAGIAFPVIIHLWNDKQGKVMAIGSIAFLEKGSRRQARNRRLSEWWLLLLRCLLLLLLALLLSGPSWQRLPEGKLKKGWVLVGEERAGRQEYKGLIDSLLKAGYERHSWEGEASYWDLFRAADRQAPAGIPFYVFTSGSRRGFTGRRPATSRSISWYTYTPSPDSIATWIREAWLSSPDSIGVLTASSRPTGNTYSYQVLPAKAGTMTAINPGVCRIGLTNGRWSVALDSQPPVIVDTTALLLSVYTDNRYTNDGRYLVAAFHALQQFTRKNIRVNMYGSDYAQAPRPNSASRPAWVFWLSSRPVPAGLSSDNLVCYEPGREIPVDTWMQGLTGVAVEKLVGAVVAKAGAAPAKAAADAAGQMQDLAVIWSDGYGRPLLTLGKGSGGRIFHFFSHFDPAWNGLVWSPRFPALLQDLLSNPTAESDPSAISSAFFNEAPIDNSRDRRVLDPGQILPYKRSSEDNAGSVQQEEAGLSGIRVAEPFADQVLTVGQPGSPADGRPTETIDLAPACWILVFLLFLAERKLSFRSPKAKTYG